MSERCESCYYWKGGHSDSKAECDKTGRITRYDDDCTCGRYTSR